MIKAILVIITTAIVSLYYFPFPLTFLPGVTGKTIMAVIGLVMFGYQHACKKSLILTAISMNF